MKKTAIGKNYFGLNFVATGEETNGKYFMSSATIPAGDQGPPIHSHTNEDECFYVTKGKLFFWVNNEKVLVKAGEFLNVEKGERHTWKNDFSEDVELIVIFTPSGIEKMFMELELNMKNLKEIGIKYGTKFEI